MKKNLKFDMRELDLSLRRSTFQYSILIDKDEKVRVIPYNFDYTTFLFGGFTFLYRKEFLLGISILLLQGGIFYLAPIPIAIILNFLLTGLIALISGRERAKSILRKGGISFSTYEDNGYKLNYEDEYTYSEKDDRKGERLNKKIKRDIKDNNRLFAILTLIPIVISSIAVFGHMKFNNKKSVLTTATKGNEEYLKGEVLFLPSQKGELIGFTFLNIDLEEKKIESISYPVDLIVNYDGKSTTLGDIFKGKNYIPEEVLKNNFNKDNMSEVTVKIETLKEFKGEEDKNIKDIILNTDKLSDEEYKEFLKNFKLDLNGKEKEINEDEALEFRDFILLNENDLNNIYKEKTGEYHKKKLDEILNKDEISLLSKKEKDSEFNYLKEEDLNNYSPINKIKEEVLDKKKRLEEEKNKENESNNESNEDVDNSSNSNNNSDNNYNSNNNYRPNGSNSGTSSGGSTSGNGSSGVTKPTNPPKPTKPPKPTNPPKPGGSGSEGDDSSSGGNDNGSSEGGESGGGATTPDDNGGNKE